MGKRKVGALEKVEADLYVESLTMLKLTAANHTSQDQIFNTRSDEIPCNISSRSMIMMTGLLTVLDLTRTTS